MSAPLRVVHAQVSLLPRYGGPARSVTALCDALADDGATVDLLTLDNASPGERPVMPRHPGVTVERVAGLTDASGLVIWSPRFRSAVRRHVGDGGRVVLHDHGLWRQTNHAMAAVARATRTPLVVSVRGMLEPWARAHKRGRKRVAWALYAGRDLRSASVLHATSPVEAANLRALGLRQPIAVIPNGVSLAADPAPPAPDRTVRQCVFIGRLARVKGLIPLVAAWAAVRPAGWRLAIAGPDEAGHRAELTQAIADAALADSVVLLGEVADADKWALLARSDVLVLPSHSESFGVAVAEALAAGRPAIATTAAPWRSLVEQQCGWQVDPTADALAGALSAVTRLTDADRAAMGVRARSLAESSFSWPGVAHAMHDVYRWVLDGTTPPSSIRAD